MTDKIEEAFNSFWLGEGAEDVTEPGIQEAFGKSEPVPTPWDYNIAGPSLAEEIAWKLEDLRHRRERIIGLTFPQWEKLGTKGLIDLASAIEEYING